MNVQFNKKKICSHDWRDIRYVEQLVYNWSIAPYMSLRTDGQPDKFMQYGQTYQCSKCKETIEIPEVERD
jgi:hypothetical protein